MKMAFAAAAACALCGCSRPPSQPASKPASHAPPVRITQFYATPPQLSRGEKGLLCYGVENAKSVWLSPPRRELSAALSRCIDIEPAQTTTYTLTAEGDGRTARQDVTVTMGAAKAHIVEVRVSSLDIKAGDPVSICYKVANARSVRVEPVLSPSETPNCGIAHPSRTTTYTVTATGAAGDQDHERVTVKVR
jgi:type IV pilus biogenesis protein CpaD/CtpE